MKRLKLSILIFCLLNLSCFFGISDGNYAPEIDLTLEYQGKDLIFHFHPSKGKETGIDGIILYGDEKTYWEIFLSLNRYTGYNIKYGELHPNDYQHKTHIGPLALINGKKYKMYVNQKGNMNSDCFRFYYDPENKYGKKDFVEKCESLNP
ncbi:hypothetical protein LFX25_03015 [Leptospira sp. FAT2]|uniref:hypothetical protein n=1 Tax=Leptospira sanjuanensis TaxID=2879643 RepID=UPI001EE7FFF2|nr:hypothetical protein [Leptospira sanjuanensis]MCG6166819.1 hypothetical protein [Leptospira sanjuanensis]MCG6192214.1 hypothetical protein [Leptospira sanjuanensis]